MMADALRLMAREQPGRGLAAALSLGVHLLFGVFLVFGVSWQTREPPAMEVELWPGPPALPAAQPARTEPEPEPAPKPAQRPDPRPVSPPVEPKPLTEKSAPSKADIELKRRQDALRADELRRQQDEIRREQEQLRALKEQQLRQVELQRQRDEALRAQTQQLATAQARVINEHKARIQRKIRSAIVLPVDMTGNPQAEFEVRLMPNGEVMQVRLLRSSGHRGYDEAVERAIFKAQPLPLPTDPALLPNFRELNLRFRPNE